MKTKLFAAALAVLTLASVSAASAQDYRRGDFWRHRADINIRLDNGRQFAVERGERLYDQLVRRPFGFQPGMTYAYTDRCNRQGCMVFVFDRGRSRPVDRIFAPHLPDRRHAWREARDFDRSYASFGRYTRDDRWHNDNDRAYRQERDGRDDRGRVSDDRRDGAQRDGDGRRGDVRRDGGALAGGPRN